MFKSRVELRENLHRRTQQQMANKHGCSRTQINKIIDGTADNQMILNELLKIATKEKERLVLQEKFRKKNRKMLQE